MSEREQLRAFPLIPVFRQDSPNARIDLGTTSIILSGDDANPSVSANARMVFTTKDRLEILVPNTTGKPPFQRFFEGINDEGTELTFAESGDSVSAMFSGVDGGVDVFHPMRSPIVARRKHVPIKRTVFHLVNWPNFSGPEDFVLITGTSPYHGARGCGRLSLKVDGWSIKIVEVDNVDLLLKELKSKGGFVITHVGVIERDGGAAYSDDELSKVTSMLGLLFSFALARWAGPQLQVGYDTSGGKSFESWGFGHLASGAWDGSTSWFDERHSEILQQVLPGFLHLWRKEVWKDALNDVLYWYVAANRIGSGVNVDSALLFTQAALECLAWTYCVLDRGMGDITRSCG